MKRDEDENTEDTEDEISDDTSEEEDTEEEDSEDTEEEESTETEESDEDEDEEDSEEDESDSKTKQHIDLKKVPAELQEAAKRMLASHTKAMQRIPELIKQKVAEAEENLQVQYSSAIIKAKGFDNLTNLPMFKAFWADVENGRPYGFSSKFRKNGKSASAEDDDSANFDEGGKFNEESFLSKLDERIARGIQSALGPIKEEKAKSAWKDAEDHLPNFNKYRAAVTAKLADHPTLSIAEAYDMVAGKENVKAKLIEELRKAEEKGKKIPKKTLKPGGSSAKKLTDATIKSIDDALSHARRDVLGASRR
jgi:hypothetical protein